MSTRLWWVACCCAVLAACSGSTPTGPSTGPTLSRTRFLAFGDSITAGEVTVPVAGARPAIGRQVVVPTAAYPAHLQSMLQARYPGQAATIAVLNAGKSGEMILESKARFPEVFAASQAEVLLVMLGVNSLNIAGPDLSTEVVRDMVRLAAVRGARALVGSMVPSIPGRTLSKPAAELVIYNGKLQLMAAAEGAVFVNLYDTLLPEATTVIGVDGLHPTEAGYKRIADLFFAAIQAALEVK